MGYRKIIEKTRMEGMKEEASEAMKTSFRKKKKKKKKEKEREKKRKKKRKKKLN